MGGGGRVGRGGGLGFELVASRGEGGKGRVVEVREGGGEVVREEVGGRRDV